MNGKCQCCGKYTEVKQHEVLNKKSKHYGAVKLLCADCINQKAHYNVVKMKELRAKEQRRIMEQCNLSLEEFITEFGKSYFNTQFQDLLNDIYKDLKTLENQIKQKEKDLKNVVSETEKFEMETSIKVMETMIGELHEKAYMLENY